MKVKTNVKAGDVDVSVALLGNFEVKINTPIINDIILGLSIF